MNSTDTETMNNEQRIPEWVIAVSPRGGIYWPYTGASSFLGSYDPEKKKGLACGRDQHKVVSSLPVKREDLRNLFVVELAASEPCRVQIDLRFASANEAQQYLDTLIGPEKGN